MTDCFQTSAMSVTDLHSKIVEKLFNLILFFFQNQNDGNFQKIIKS